MSQPRIGIVAILIAVLVVLLAVVPAAAQEPAPESTPENDENCVACHTHRYYLYDSGKWFCLCDAPMHCIYCHGGRADSNLEAIAHEGLVLYPTRNHAERCRACHADDYFDRMVTFETVAGVDPTPQIIPTATPGLAGEPLQARPAALTRLGLLEPWRLAGTAGVGLLLVVLAVFAYRCYRADCLAKLRP